MKEVAIIAVLIGSAILGVIALHLAPEKVFPGRRLTAAELEWNRRGEERIESQFRLGRLGFIPFNKEEVEEFVDLETIDEEYRIKDVR